MFHAALRSILFIWQLLVIIAPLIGKGRRQKIPLVLKEGAFFVLTNWELIWKYLEKRKWSIETIRNLLKFRRMR
jgi:hypothetical protein